MFETVSQQFSSVFNRLLGRGSLGQQEVDQFLEKVRTSLIEADVPYEVANSFCDDLTKTIASQGITKGLQPTEHLMKVVHERLVHFLGGVQPEFTYQIPSVCMVVGLQGSGKTTSIAKLARQMMAQAAKRGKSRRILLASVDFYRPAAVDQLELLAKRVGCDFYRAQSTDVLQAAREIYQHFQQQGYEHLFLDTAGRLHVDEPLLAELKALDALVKPKYKFLVIDSMIGQESLTVAKKFAETVGYTGALLTKTDSDTRGGVAFAFRYAIKLPILFVGSGEGIEDLEPFYVDRIAQQILGMGDMQTLLERAQEKIKQSEQERLAKSYERGVCTLQDFADQMNMVGKLGSLQSIAKYLPGMGQVKISDEDLEKGERELKKFRAIIQSMTKTERLVPKILDASRKRRIAQGAGVLVQDVNQLLARFEQNQQFVKMFKKMRFFN